MRGRGVRWTGVVLMGVFAGWTGLHAQEAPRALGPAVETVQQRFSSVSTVRVTSQGAILLADPTERSVYRVDPATGGVRNISREGEGPGEYLQPSQALPLPGDSTLISDGRLGRYLIVAPDGSVARTVTLQGAAGLIRSQHPRATDARGRVYVRERDGGNLMMTPGMDMNRAVVQRMDPRTGAVEAVADLALVRTEDRPMGEPVVSGGGLHMTQALVILPTPWGLHDAWGVLADGTVAVVRGGDETVVEWSDGGTTPLPLSRAAVTAADRGVWYEAWLEAEAGHSGDVEQLGRAVRESELEWPDRKAPFSGTHTPADPLNRLWLRVTDMEAAAPVYAVFDRAGAFDLIRLPEGGALAGFSQERVWITVTDDLGQVSVSAHPLPGNGDLEF